MTELLRLLKERSDAFRSEGAQILALQESSKHRVITIDQTRRSLNALSLRQQAIFEEALRCVEEGLYRAAHVLAWAAAMDNLEEKLASDGLVKMHSVRTNWAKWASIEEIRENINEYQILDAARDVGILSKSELKVLQGDLAKRNQCAHPSEHSPDLNESLGYISGLLTRLQRWSGKPL